MPVVEQRNRHENDIGDRDHAGLGWREHAGENAAHDDNRDHQWHGGFFGRRRKLSKSRALAFESQGAEEVAVNHQPDADQHSGDYAARNSPPIETLPVAP